MQFSTGQHVHFVGIGGIGLSAIARVLLERGYRVSGSDRARNALTDALARDGATIYEGHHADNIDGADMVIISSAVRNNPEVIEAESLDIPVYKRQDIMAALLAHRRVIAVAGTAGKTTTTALIAHILTTCGKPAGYIVGGVMGNTGTNAANGNGRDFVVEADEYDNMFHGLRPNLALITNIEYDHPDFFKDEAALFASFEKFTDQLTPDGALLLCADDAGTRQLYQQQRRGHTYGLSEDAHYRAQNIRQDADGFTLFDVTWAAWMTSDDGKPTKHHLMGTVRLPMSGTHNIQNALGALIVATRFCHLPFEQAAAALETFQGTGRRFEQLGEAGGVTVIDDYAHHPAKIRATLQGARSRYPQHAIWAIWQPHTYSRTQTLLHDFETAFQDADHVLVTDIYAARELPIKGIDGASVAQRIQQQHKSVNFVASFDDAVALLLENVQNPAVVVVMSAGDANQIGKNYLAEQTKRWKS